MRQAVVLLLTPRGKNEVLLLAEKKDGRHRGRLIAPSETMEAGETPLQTALRCVQEEVVGTQVFDLRAIAQLRIVFEVTPGRNIELFVFHGTFTGCPEENEELWNFQVFRFGDVPISRMWDDAPLWLGRLLRRIKRRNFTKVGWTLTKPRPRFIRSRFTPTDTLESAA
jgi:8-oxo-dGTP pyrophosphatase MutT (NUDIX family)